MSPPDLDPSTKPEPLTESAHMTTRTRRKVAATIAAASLALAGGVATAPAAAAAPVGSDLDYFSHAYPGLRDDSVFETVTFERFEYLLQSEGTYAFLIGGPADATTNAAITHIDAVAQQYGVERVYVFDPRVDGDKVDIRTSSITVLQDQWNGAVADFLNKDTAPAFGGDPADDPYLFIYDKTHKAGESEDRIVASLGGALDAAAVATDEGAAAYRTQVAGVFDAIAEGGSADVDAQTQFTFYKNEVNRKHTATYKNAALYGGDILTESDGADWKIQQITYPELVQLLESDGDHVILFGGTWCHNTRAVFKDVNRAAATAGVRTVYQFDLRLDGNSSNAWHIRDTASPLAYLYGDVVAQFFPNLRTQYSIAAGGGQKVDYYPGGDTSIAVASAKKLQVPYLVEYNKANASAPIVQDWIRDNGNGTFTEYMTEWWWVADLPGERNLNRYPTAEAWAAEQDKQWAFADEAIAKLDGFFGLATAPSAPAAPGVTVAGSDATVTWTAPSDGGSALTGYQIVVDGGAPIAVAPEASSHTLSGLAAGAHSVTLAAKNYLGTSPASAAKSFEIAVAEPGPGSEPEPEPAAEPRITVTGDLRPGGSIVVAGTGLPASTPGVVVEIRSTPQTLGTLATAADGTIRLETTIPTSVAPGAHTVVVLLDGQVVASQPVTVSSAAGAVASASSLPATGGGGIPFIVTGIALVLVAVGAIAVVIARKTRSESV